MDRLHWLPILHEKFCMKNEKFCMKNDPPPAWACNHPPALASAELGPQKHTWATHSELGGRWAGAAKHTWATHSELGGRWAGAARVTPAAARRSHGP